MLASRLKTRRSSRIGGTTLASSTFARTGTAYQDGVSYAGNTPRFPNTAGTVGVLVEEGTTNLVTANTASVETDASGFSALGTPPATLSRDTTEKFSGAASLKVVCDGTAIQQGAVTAPGSTVTGTYTGQVRIKGPAGATLEVRLTSGALNVITLTGGWDPITPPSVTYSALVTNLIIRTNVAQAITFWVDCVQIENKAYATTWHLPGTTRNAETLTIPTAGIMRSDRGTVIVRAYMDSGILAAPLAHNLMLFNVSNTGDLNNRLALFVTNGTGQRALRCQSSNAAGGLSDTNAGIGTPAGWRSFALTWSASRLRGYYDGTPILNVNAPSLPDTMATSAYLASPSNGTWGTVQLGMPMAYVAIYDRALSDAEMAQATSGNLPAGYTALLDFRGGKLEPSKRRGVTLNDYLSTYCTRD